MIRNFCSCTEESPLKNVGVGFMWSFMRS